MRNASVPRATDPVKEEEWSVLARAVLNAGLKTSTAATIVNPLGKSDPARADPIVTNSVIKSNGSTHLIGHALRILPTVPADPVCVELEVIKTRVTFHITDQPGAITAADHH